MSQVKIQGNASGTGIFTVASPNSNTDRTLTLPDATGTVVVSGTTPTLNGIAFPATQALSADANTLDDYEEGTFTPSLTFGGGSTGITYGDRRGQYVKIGQNVFVNVYILLSNKGSSTGVANINGFPFATAASIDFFAPLAPRGNLNSGGNPVSLYSGSNFSTAFDMYSCNLTGSGNNQLSSSAFANNTELNFNFWYKTNT